VYFIYYKFDALFSCLETYKYILVHAGKP